jgi:putative SOS response-associated peptidase YedK
MCGRFVQYSHPEIYAASFDLDLGQETAQGVADRPRPRYNLAPTQEALVIRAREDGTRHLDPMRWGLIPSWSKGSDNRYQMINARAETLAQKPAYRTAFRERRCVVPAEGFYEWREEPRAGGRYKQPYLIRRADRRPFAMAGLWDLWREPVQPEGERTEIRSFTIVVTDANPAIRSLHDRMPVILPPEQLATWLDPEEQEPVRLHTLLACTPSEGWTLEPVSSRVNSPRNDDVALIEPLTPTP